MKNIFILLFILITGVLNAATNKVKYQELRLGTGVLQNTYYSVDIGTGSFPQIRYNSTSSLWEISDDGTTFRNIGDDATKITGPASSTNNQVFVADGITGKLAKVTPVQIDPSNGEATGLGAIQVGTSSASTISNVVLNNRTVQATGGGLTLSTVTSTDSVNFPRAVQFQNRIVQAFQNDTATGSNVTLTTPAAKYIRLTAAGTLVSIDMIPALTNTEIVLVNQTGADVRINNLTGGTANNQINTTTGTYLTLKAGAQLPLVYDTSAAKWMAGGSAGINVSYPVASNQGVYGSGSGVLSSLAGTSYGSGLYSISGLTLTALKRINLNASVTSIGSSVAVSDSATANMSGTLSCIDRMRAVAASQALAASCSVNGILEIGGTVTLAASIAGSATTPSFNYSINATEIVQENAWVSTAAYFSSDANALTHKTTAIVSGDPVGTYNTYSYAINTNTKTICATAPSVLPNLADGFLVFARPYNAASTCGNPARVEIKLAPPGTDLPTLGVSLYKSTGKTISGNADAILSAATTISGALLKNYNASTGVFTFDAGWTYTGVTTANFLFDDLTGQTSGYLNITAQKAKDSVTGVFNSQISQQYKSDFTGTFTSGTINYGTPTLVTGANMVNTLISHSAGIYTALVPVRVWWTCSGRSGAATRLLVRTSHSSLGTISDGQSEAVSGVYTNASASAVLQVGEGINCINTNTSDTMRVSVLAVPL